MPTPFTKRWTAEHATVHNLTITHHTYYVQAGWWLSGRVEPWFGQPGMGVQHYLSASFQNLLDAGYLREVG